MAKTRSIIWNTRWTIAQIVGTWLHHLMVAAIVAPTDGWDHYYFFLQYIHFSQYALNYCLFRKYNNCKNNFDFCLNEVFIILSITTVKSPIHAFQLFFCFTKNTCFLYLDHYWVKNLFVNDNIKLYICNDKLLIFIMI